MKGSYAVVWSEGDKTVAGRLEATASGFELHDRTGRHPLQFAQLAGASIARRPADRLRGLPVLLLVPRDGAPVRVASLEGAGVLHELAQHVQRAGLTVGA